MLVGEVQLAHEARVSFPQHGVAISWNNLTRLEGLIDELVDAFACPIVTVLFFEGKEEVEAFLVGAAVERSSKTSHACSEGEVRISEG